MLNAQHELFCQAYATNGFNATKAAEAAGFSPISSRNQGHRLLQNFDVQLRVEELKLATTTKLQLTRERVIEEFARIGLSDVRKVFGEGRALKNIQDLDDDTAAAVESIEVVANTGDGEEVIYTHKIKLASKVAALKNLGQHFNIYEDHQKSGMGEIHVHIEGKDAEL